MSRDLQSLVDAIYNKTRGVYQDARDRLVQSGGDHGFKILYGPARLQPKFLIIGFQPGGDASHIRQQEMQAPSPVNDYLNETWPLATTLRGMFGEDFLLSSLGTNVVFFRSPDIASWRRIPVDLRFRLEAFCRSQLQQLIAAIHPSQLLILGWDALQALGVSGFRELVASGAPGKRKRLLQCGHFAGTPAYAMFYPSATWKAPPVRDDERGEVIRIILSGQNV